MLLALLLVGCDPAWLEAEPVRAPIPPVIVEGIAFRSVVTRAQVPPPAFWDDGLPAQPFALGAWLHPVADGVCFGAPGARQAAEAVVHDRSWADLLARCEDPGFCDWALERGALLAATSCPDPALVDRFTAPDVPDTVVARWFAAQARRGTPIDHPRFDEAAGRLLEAADDVAAVEALEALVALPDGAARARAVARGAGAPWVADEVERLLEARVSRSDAEALARCARDEPDGWVARRCLADLARLDRAAAAAVVADLDPQYALETAVAALRRYPSTGALGEDLIRRGLLDEGAVVDGALTPAEALRDAGRGLAFEGWGDDAQGWTVRRLAALAGLGDARILVQPPLPPVGDPSGREPLRTQLAWLDGARWRALARDYGSFTDLDQAVGFVNALLHVRGATERIVVADGEGGTVAVFGDPAALQGLADEGLLLPWLPPPVSVEDGGGYEGYGYEAGP